MPFTIGLDYWGLTPQQQPGSYQGGEMMMMKSVLWWRKPEYPEETADLRQVFTMGDLPNIDVKLTLCRTLSFTRG